MLGRGTKGGVKNCSWVGTITPPLFVPISIDDELFFFHGLLGVRWEHGLDSRTTQAKVLFSVTLLTLGDAQHRLLYVNSGFT